MSAPKDCISLVGITALGKHGVYDFERQTGQTFTADVDVFTSTKRAGSTDALENTIDYSVLAEKVRAVLAGPPSNLIEQVAEHVARVALESGAAATRVRIHKPEAPIEAQAKDVTVTIWRGAQTDQVITDLAAAEGGDLPNGEAAPLPPDLDKATESIPAPGQGALEQAGHARGAVLALGANLADPVVTLRRAVADLEKVPGINLVRLSPLVRSAAVIDPEQKAQPDYLNAVLEITTTLSPRELLDECARIENSHGRVRTEHWGPRTLDIDIVTIDGIVSQDPALTLPHPRAHQRAFVLVPWSLMDPNAVLKNQQVADLARLAPDRGGIKHVWENWLDVVEAAAGNSEPAPFTGTVPLPSWEAVVRGNQTIRVVDDDGASPAQEGAPTRAKTAKKVSWVRQMWEFLRREPTPSPVRKETEN